MKFKKWFLLIFICVAFVFIVGMFIIPKPFLKEKINEEEINKIQVVLAMGNPEYGAESKIITDKDEIKAIIHTFNSAYLKAKVKDDDIVVSNCSTYYFYNDDKVIKKIFFNGNDSQRVFKDLKVYYIDYKDKQKPIEIYKNSKAEEIIVDEQLNKIERPKE